MSVLVTGAIVVLVVGVIWFFVNSIIRFIGTKADWEKRKNLVAKQKKEFRHFQKERDEWQNKMACARHLLKGNSWREPEGKEEFLKEIYGDSIIPDYLWYAVGDNRNYSGEEFEKICETFWGNLPSFGDLEMHQSYSSEVGTGLRIRHPKKFVAEIMVGDKVCPLYQTGHSMFGDIEKDCVSFLSLYNQKT